MKTEDVISVGEIEDFKEGIEAIRLISERLINLALIENNFLRMTAELKGILQENQFSICWLERAIDEQKSKQICRFKWLEKLIFKRI